MYTKLTLSIDKAVIENAKKYAKAQKRSVSKLVEEYLSSISLPSSSSLSSAENKEIEYSALGPITKELTGIIKTDGNTNYNDILTDALMEKYL
jgi:hypothetical protein